MSEERSTPGLSAAGRYLGRPLRSFRRVVFDDESLVELKAGAIIFAFAILGAVAWLIWEENEDRQVTRNLRQQFEISRFQDRQAVHKEFADAIPKNLAYLSKIAMHTIQMDTEQTALGRTIEQVYDLREGERHLWLEHCSHYTAVCEQAAARFPEPIGTTMTKIRLLFDELNDDLAGNTGRTEVMGRVLALLLIFDPDAQVSDNPTALAGAPAVWQARRVGQTIEVTARAPADVASIAAELQCVLLIDAREYYGIRDDLRRIQQADSGGRYDYDLAHDALDAIYQSINLVYVASLRGMNQVLDQRPF